MVKRDSKAPHLDVVYIDFFARRAESARMSARSSSIVVDPGVREHYVGVEVFLPETAWVDGAAGVRQAFADLFLVMDLGGRRTRWDLDSSWILELLDLPQGSDTSQVVELASEPIASLFRRGRSTAPACLRAVTPGRIESPLHHVRGARVSRRRPVGVRETSSIPCRPKSLPGRCRGRSRHRGTTLRSW